MIAGRFPFHAPSEYLTFEKVKRLDYTFPDGFDEDAKDLVQRILILDPIKRLGAGEAGTANDINALRQHPFFKSTDWQSIWVEPAPPMEAGLVKKEHPGPGDDNYDVGAAWDELVSNEGVEGQHSMGGTKRAASWSLTLTLTTSTRVEKLVHWTFPRRRQLWVFLQCDLGRQTTYLQVTPLIQEPGRFLLCWQLRRKAVLQASPLYYLLERHPIEIPSRNSISTGSTTSSSEGGSPVEKLGVAIEAISLDRGRDRSTTPIQLVIPPETQWQVSSYLLCGYTTNCNAHFLGRVYWVRANKLSFIRVLKCDHVAVVSPLRFCQLSIDQKSGTSSSRQVDYSLLR